MRRAFKRKLLTQIRAEFAWLDTDSTAVLADPDGEIRWWTFGGAGANASLAKPLSNITHTHVTADSLTLYFGSQTEVNAIEAALEVVRQRDSADMLPEVAGEAMEGLKFSECLPLDIAMGMLQNRIVDATAIRHLLAQTVRIVQLFEHERAVAAGQ